MGEQLFIIGVTGSDNPDLLKKIMAVLMDSGQQVRHASRRYQGKTTFDTGGPHDLKLELGGVESTSEDATLETVLAELREHRKEFREAVSGTKPTEPDGGPQKDGKSPRGRKRAGVPALPSGDAGQEGASVPAEPLPAEPEAAPPPVEPPPAGQEDTTGDGASPEPEPQPPAEET